MSTPFTGTSRFTITQETLRHILQEWWNENTSFPPAQVVALQHDPNIPGNPSYVFPDSIVMVLMPIDPLLVGQREMPSVVAPRRAPTSQSHGAVGATGHYTAPYGVRVP